MADTEGRGVAGETGDAHEQLIGLLLTEQRGSDPAAYLSGEPSTEDPTWGGWLRPAAALAAGEPKRALALLARSEPAPPGHAPLAGALRAAAVAMEHNWHPGAAFLHLRREDFRALTDADSGTEAAIASITDPPVRLCAHLAGQVGVVLLSARMTLGHATASIAARSHSLRYAARSPWTEREPADDVLQPLEWFDALYEPLVALGHADVRAYHRLLAADLRVRAGDRATATPLLRDAEQCITGNHAAEGFAALLTGDWQLGPPGTAECCTLEPAAPDPAVLAAAAASYERAEASYGLAKSSRGRAAALLRLAHTHRLAGRHEKCRDLLGQALGLAVSAGDGGCTALVRVHQALGLIEAGEAGEAESAAAERIVNWATTDGSSSWLRGLRHLVEDRSRYWGAQGEVVKSKRAGLLAMRLTSEPAGGRGNPTARATAGSYQRAGHRLATFVLSGMEQQEHLHRIRQRTDRGEPLDLTDCLGVIQCGKVLHDQASALRDPDLIAAARSSIQSAIDVAESLLTAADAKETDTDDTGSASTDALRSVLGMLESDLVTSRAQETWFRSRRARSAGLDAEADLHAHQTLREAERITDPMFAGLVRCSAHLDLRNRSAARAEVAAIEEHLSASQAAALWLNVGEPERAAPYVRRIGADGPEPAQPWELPAFQADLELGRGVYDKAAGHALRGLSAYEERRIRLARDALRASSADDPVVAGLYHAAVLSLLEGCRPDAAAASFDVAERTRSGFLDAVRALDAVGDDQAAHTAVRNWLAAEIRWSAQFETEAAALRRSAVTAPVPERRRRIDEVERDLDAAESEVRRLAPAAFTASHTTEPPDAAAVATALSRDAVLLTYHLHDDDLVGWAMTRDTLRPRRHARWAHGTVASVRRFHAWCAGEDGGGDGEADGQELADLMLEPFRRQLRDRRKVIVILPAGLALLPFHALPWDGDLLGATHEVSYLPAASLLTRRQPPERPWPELDALLVGNPATTPRLGLAPLPGTAAETAEIARLLPRHRLLTGTAATRAEVLQAASNCAVIHLATHGLIDDLAPHRGRLQLAGDDHFGLADLLTAARAPQLLTLSACDTGRGTATAGGDVLGLTRAALITGARHAVVSLWPVRDSTGCLVITRTYRRLADDPAASVGAALAQAQLEVRNLSATERDEEFRALSARAGECPGPAYRSRSWHRLGTRDSEQLRSAEADDRHPYHWAPFIHVGV
ncbi:CHAT domain-containing protein [Streptomyces sp. 5-8]|uniref:CHAT domain-containing protein n=1 Tax=Streptomyces musisoli TaxID=2802280 RepID=A0ABS1P2M7_9ACTN|nr:CHAT domain-containing protein [Streptomyces musisoli]MBL1106628.1 CHAT domain-containing protein [Streptomyces musisoli]